MGLGKRDWRWVTGDRGTVGSRKVRGAGFQYPCRSRVGWGCVRWLTRCRQLRFSAQAGVMAMLDYTTANFGPELKGAFLSAPKQIWKTEAADSNVAGYARCTCVRAYVRAVARARRPSFGSYPSPRACHRAQLGTAQLSLTLFLLPACRPFHLRAALYPPDDAPQRVPEDQQALLLLRAAQRRPRDARLPAANIVRSFAASPTSYSVEYRYSSSMCVGRPSAPLARCGNSGLVGMND